MPNWNTLSSFLRIWSRQHEAGLPTIMHGNAKSLEHHITTTPSDPEVHQQTCTRDMQPVEPAPCPETGPGRAMVFP
ncbi:MAG: hypothetical protein OXC57_10355 [Rhodobacteraceae bacterium]|nr:hypothetical protein [Paracoccaceae bacterium]